MLDVLERCFPDRYQSWLPTLKDMGPSLGTTLSREPALYEEVWSLGTKALRLGPGDNAVGALPAAQRRGGEEQRS
jgi:malate dehydrogenase (quinone)